jgi:hypothetical protein
MIHVDLRALYRLIQEPNIKADYAEYVDEQDPSKGVNLKTNDGVVRMWIPLDVWDDLRKT